MTTGQGTPETSDDDLHRQPRLLTGSTVGQMIDESADRPSPASGPRLDPIDDDGSHSFSADAVTTLMDGQGGNDTIDGRGVNGITLLGGAGDDNLYNGYNIRGGDGPWSVSEMKHSPNARFPLAA